MKKNISIIGSGSWGTALAIHLAKKGHNVKVWSFMKEEADLINNERKCMFLPNIKIPDNIICTTDFKTAIENTELILIVTPSKAVFLYINLESKPAVINADGSQTP